MTNKALLLMPLALIITACSGPGQARHQQCQEMKENAYGERWGAALSGGVGQIRADIDQAAYERCEEMFDLVQYKAQLQQEQEQAQAQEQAQERKELLQEKVNSPEMREKLRSSSIEDLVNCEKAVQNKNDTHPEDVKAMVSYVCEKEIDRRIDDGIVSRSKVNKMLNQG
ncbi:hypothetical protein [Enterobacter soli]|uniref:hypothetical protein n=1 Tax=Enterobacter soli TaxID=885040 RepID=UPI0034CD1EBF